MTDATQQNDEQELVLSDEATPSAPISGVPLVFNAITQVLADLGANGIGKNRRNTQQNYNFRGIDDVYNALNRFLAHRKLVILPRVVSREMTERTSKQDKALFHSVVEVEFDLVCSIDGSKHTVRFPGEAMDSGDKGINKAMTAAFKYLCFEIFCIPLQGNDEGRDADASSHEVRRAPSPPPEPEQSPQDFVDAIEIAPNLEALKKVFGDAWRGYREPDFRKRFQTAYDKRKAELE